MDLPKFHETFIPILEVLSNGEILHYNDLRKKVREAPNSIILIDGNKLIDLMHQYGVGVQDRNTYEVKEVDEDFFEES